MVRLGVKQFEVLKLLCEKGTVEFNEIADKYGRMAGAQILHRLKRKKLAFSPLWGIWSATPEGVEVYQEVSAILTKRREANEG
jgi:hypothetical protein